MARDQKGGVHTKKMIAIAAAFALAVLAISMIPSASADDNPFSTYSDIRAETYMAGIGTSIDYTIFAVSDTVNDATFTAKLTDQNGNTVSRVSPSSGRVSGTDGTVLSVTAPSSAGSYTLVVDFTYTDSGDTSKTVTKTAPLWVVVPVKLSATLVNNSGTLTGMEVWFIVDGNIIEDSKQTVEIGANSSKTVTHDWITGGLSDGRHKVELTAEVGQIGEGVKGLDTPTYFYVGQTSYALTEALLVVLLIIMLIVLIVIARKPVKNVGKPKGRR